MQKTLERASSRAYLSHKKRGRGSDGSRHKDRTQARNLVQGTGVIEKLIGHIEGDREVT